ncbi:hypothetical protein JOB18_040679, partial [Solea senegalensis]
GPGSVFVTVLTAYMGVMIACRTYSTTKVEQRAADDLMFLILSSSVEPVYHTLRQY